MYKKLIFFGFLILLLSNYAFAVIINEPALPTQPQELQNWGELTARLSNIESKINALPTNQSITNLLQGHLELTNQIIDNFRSAIVVLQIIINVAFLGVAFGIYFNLKSKGRV
jgi:hypothetical protein